MFGWFKPRPAPDGPLVVEFDIAIDRPAADVYPLIDFADPRHHKREVGTVEQTGDNTFRMVLDMVPDLVFDMTVSESVSPKSYAFSTDITPPVGRLVESSERYEIEETDPQSCVLQLTCMSRFEDGMTMKQFKEEVVNMSVAVNNALAKLKIHAEQGVEAIREIERHQMS